MWDVAILPVLQRLDDACGFPADEAAVQVKLILLLSPLLQPKEV